MRRTLVLLLATLVATLASAAGGHAQSAIDVRASEARIDFPNGIVFTLDAASPGGFDEVRLIYQIAPDGVRASGVADCTGGTRISCRFDLGGGRQTVLIHGAELTYFWAVTVDGETEETEPQLVVYADTRFDWRTVSEGNLTLYWYDGSEDEARRVLAAGRESLDSIGALLQTEVNFPVKIIYYASARDMQAASIADNQEGVVTLGEVFYSDTALVSADFAPTEIARHEIAHIVVRQTLRGPFGVPDWLNEGTAVFAQSQPLSGQRDALERAIGSGRVFSVRSLSSASSGAQASNVSLFYGQSYGLVAFLVDTYGEERYAQLFQAFKDGSNTSQALEDTYGFNQDGLENAWRANVGLPPREAPTPGDGASVPTAPQPTQPAEPSSTVGGGGSATATVIVVVLAAVLAVIAGGTIVLIARRVR